MPTQGYFISAIIDDLSDVSRRIAINDELALLSINTIIEDFFKMVLNHACGLKLKNLNRKKVNYPGLDLGDAAAGIAFQVTADRSSDKVNDTLKKIANNGTGPFKKIHVFVTGSRQKKYSLDEELCKQLGFSNGDIWDVVEVCKRCMDLPVGKLRDLHKNIRQEMQRVLIELETRDGDGNYPTNLIDSVDPLIAPTIGELARITAYFEAEGYIDIVQPRDVFEGFVSRLRRLPRLTRELLGIIIDRREVYRLDGREPAVDIEINVDRLAASIPAADMERDIRLLVADGFLRKKEEWDNEENRRWQVDLAGRQFESVAALFNRGLKQFLDKEDLGVREEFVGLNFEQF